MLNAARNISNSKFQGEGGGRWAAIRLNHQPTVLLCVVAPAFTRPSELQKPMEVCDKEKVTNFHTF
ncbi:MAG: hypothetical protein M3264_05455, partial [Thermoproteota archaeon]|nr:hypothetical protein [Thermoproteota archaeon]